MSVPEGGPIRVGFVLHVMQVAGAEVLVAETIRRLGQAIEPIVLCLDGVGQLGERVRSAGVPVIDLKRRPGIDFPVSRRLAREIAGHQLEIVHAHQYTPFFYTALARPQVRHRFHVMFTEHGRHFPDVVSAKRRLLNRVLLGQGADEINGVCQFSARSLAEVDGFAGRHIEVIPNGVDLPRYGASSRTESRARLGLEQGRRYAICVARFHPVKDHAMLLRAFARVASTVADVDLLLAGDGPLRAELERHAAGLGVASRVRFLGVRSDIPELLSAADVFLLTSVSEAASLTLLEAMGTGLPVVVTDVGGNGEIVEHGVHGYLVQRGDDAAAAAALSSLLEDRSAADRMGAAARERVATQYALDRTVSAYYERYRRAVRGLRAADGERAWVRA